eukprot:scaffold41923_cov33-Cyclotella_meneghiniana.AAC.1
MKCQNKGLWHLGISDEACENAGGKWFRTPCLTLKETVDGRPSRFDLENPLEGSCQDNLKSFETAVVSASTGDGAYPFEATLDGCHEFCRSLPDYSAQMGMMTHQTEASSEISDCTCIYRNEKFPSRDSMPSYSKPSPPKFALTNSDGMALGLRPNIDCNATDDLIIETQIADTNNPRQQFQVTLDGQVVSVLCPKKVLTTVLGSDGVTSCSDGVGLQLKEYGFVPATRNYIEFTNGLDNSLCMDVKDGHTHNGTPVQLSNCNGSDGQKWFVDSLGRIRSKLDVNKCVEAGASDKPYAKLFVTDCNYERHQQWIFVTDGRIRNKKYAKYIGVSEGCMGVNSGIRLELQWNLVNSKWTTCVHNQQWIQKKASDLQRWTFNEGTGSISNVGCPNLAISSSKQKDVSLNSIYFALQNPRTQLAIGISADSCTNGMTLEMQDLKYGSPNQQFIYNKDAQKIVSVICPEFAITLPSSSWSCATTGDGLVLSSNPNDGNKNMWLFEDDKGLIRSVRCPHKFITINGASSGGARLVKTSKFLEETLGDTFGEPPEQQNAADSPTAAYTDESRKVKTEWEQAAPPSVGSTVILSDLNAKRYQKWTKQRQLFHPLMGPFSVVNPNSRLAMTVDGGT